MKYKIALACSMLVISILSIVFYANTDVHAQQSNEFSLQVSPSPLVLTAKPGETSDTELRIKNLGTKKADIQVELRQFDYDSNTEQINLKDDKVPQEIANAVKFDSYTFTLEPNESIIRNVRVGAPKDSKFAYSFAIVLKKTNIEVPKDKTRKIKGEVAVFTLLDIDKDGVKRSAKVNLFSVDKKSTDYLPITFKTKLENNGNTFLRPYGNIYVSRSKNSTNPIAVLPVNPNGSYILPDTKRTVSTQWQDGFPRRETTSDGKTKVVWNFKDLNKLRIGKYHAKLVAVYNDGKRDVPIESSVTFWVLPWKIIGAFIVFLVLIGVGIFTLTRSTIDIGSRFKRSHRR
jgi:hypothetical protein